MTQTASDNDVPMNLMARLWDEEYFRDRIHPEEASGCDIGTAPNYAAHLGQFLADPQGFKQRERLQRLLIGQFRQILVDCNLGVGIEAATTCGAAILKKRLQRPTAEQQEILERVLLLEEESDRKLIPALLDQILVGVLLPEDWEEIATAAAEKVRLQVLEQRLFAKTA
jgi:hypothetical protein